MHFVLLGPFLNFFSSPSWHNSLRPGRFALGLVPVGRQRRQLPWCGETSPY